MDEQERKNMKVLKIDHVAMAVADKARASSFLTDILGARLLLDESWEYRGQEFSWAYFDIGSEGRIEIVSSSDPDNFINRYIQKHGEGLHHLTLRVENLEEAVEWLQSRGIRVVDVNVENPHWKEAFISPRDACGVLIQLAEYDEGYWDEEYGG